MGVEVRGALADCCIALALFLALCALTSAKDDAKSIFEGVSAYGPCMVQATFSFLYPVSKPPRSEAELKALCKSQAEGIKCVKERTKGALPILRRGALAYASTRNKHHRKVCSNTASEQSRRLLAATKCIADKRMGAYRANDLDFLHSLLAIARRNYNDSAAELKQLCCAFHFYRRNISELAVPACAQHQAEIEELASEIVSRDVEVLCDDEEKLAKSCAKLERIQPPERDPNAKLDDRVHASSLAIYLIATLGEPNTDPSFKI